MYYGYIYLTENIINGMCYIGMHKSSTFDLDYKGSGKLLRRAFKKYGWDNFVCQPIAWAKTRQELSDLEKYYGSKCNVVESKTFYNIKDCGDGGWDYVNEKVHSGEIVVRHGKWSQESKDHESEMTKGSGNNFYGKRHSDKSKKQISESGKKMWEKNRDRFIALSLSKEAKWYTNGIDSERKIAKDGVVPDGWYAGRLIVIKKYWWTDDIDEIKSDACPAGWHRGRSKSSKNKMSDNHGGGKENAEEK